jgi:hypothetical protein
LPNTGGAPVVAGDVPAVAVTGAAGTLSGAVTSGEGTWELTTSDAPTGALVTAAADGEGAGRVGVASSSSLQAASETASTTTIHERLATGLI